MFKKPFKVSAQNQLSGKDRKTIKAKLVQAMDQACVQKIFNLNEKIISCKTSSSKMMIYNGNDYPLFVDGTGKNDFFPSLYTAIAFQPLLKVVDLNEGVESYIYNGANLMWPGVRDLSGLGQFEKDQVVGVRTAKGQLIAIGAMGCSLKDLNSNPDKSGVSVYILHYLNDKLWQSGTKIKPDVIVHAEKPKKVEEKKQQVKQQTKIEQKQVKKGKKQEEQPIEKVQKKQKKKQEQKGKQKEKEKQKEKPEEKGKDKKKQKETKKESSQQEKEQKKPTQKDEESDQVDFTNIVHTKKQKEAPKAQKYQKKNQPKKNFSDDQEEQKKGKKKPAKKQAKKKGGKKQEENEQNSEGQEKMEEVQHPKSSVSTKLMDQQFKEALLNAIKLSKVQGQLPIDSGRFFMDYMLLARPQGVKLEIKDTSYKKLGKFYEQMGKQKIIEFKHNKEKKGQQGSSITKIMWDNEQLKNYEPTLLKMNQKQVQQKEPEGQDANKKKVKPKITQSLEVESVYKLHQNFKKNVFSKKINYAPTQQQEIQMKKQQEDIKNQPQFYSQTEVKVLIEKYINEKVVPRRDKEKKQQKKEKADKMLPIDYKNNPYLADLLKKEIQEYIQNTETNKQVDSQQQQDKKGKKKRQNVMKIDRNYLVNKILKTCSTSYHMRDKQTGHESFHEGTFKGIQIIAQKSNNKNITKIVGLQTFIIPKQEADQFINTFANKLKQKFACSVNVQNLPGKNAGKEIIAHGSFITELEEIFTEEYKINAEYIKTQNKLEKKKKN